MGILISRWERMIFDSASEAPSSSTLFILNQKSFSNSKFLSFSREINVRVELIFLLFDLLSLRKLLTSLEANPIITPKMVEIIGIYPVIFNVKISSIN
ncbi:hypothetical protein BK008_10915 [Methanobacterium sp. MZ-A1]|nr:hypothetical protein BK008_10915 [Methanobacterium sp. MZ-A1]